jgi:hypothetical protein
MLNKFRFNAFLGSLSVLGLSAVSATALAQAPRPTSSPGAMPPTMTAPPGAADVKGTLKMSKVAFVEPKDGATVKPTFHMMFSVEGLKVLPAGEIVPGSGHFHVIVDEGPTPEGTVVGTDDKHIHYGKGQMEADLKLAPGSHKLTLQFADGAHRSYGPKLSQTITVQVK